MVWGWVIIEGSLGKKCLKLELKIFSSDNQGDWLFFLSFLATTSSTRIKKKHLSTIDTFV